MLRGLLSDAASRHIGKTWRIWGVLGRILRRESEWAGRDVRSFGTDLLTKSSNSQRVLSQFDCFLIMHEGLVGISRPSQVPHRAFPFRAACMDGMTSRVCLCFLDLTQIENSLKVCLIVDQSCCFGNARCSANEVNPVWQDSQPLIYTSEWRYVQILKHVPCRNCLLKLLWRPPQQACHGRFSSHHIPSFQHPAWLAWAPPLALPHLLALHQLPAQLPAPLSGPAAMQLRASPCGNSLLEAWPYSGWTSHRDPWDGCWMRMGLRCSA